MFPGNFNLKLEEIPIIFNLQMLYKTQYFNSAIEDVIKFKIFYGVIRTVYYCNISLNLLWIINFS